MKFKKLLYMGVAGLLTLSSCNDFLDKLPDNRVPLDETTTPTQLLLMLVDGYSVGNYAKYCEFSSDNIVDNNSPDPASGIRYNLPADQPLDNEIFAWEEPKSDDMQQDSPYMIWEQGYHAIAVANHVLSAIEQIRAAGKDKTMTEEDQAKLDAAYGEALVIRAYNHFVLVNIFAQHYAGPEASKNLPGIPYMDKVEDKVSVQYARQSVAEVYDRIEADMLEGMKHLNDAVYSQPKYHFTRTAANAFASRFYLYKRDYPKVEEYATAALGSNPEQMMRTYWNQTYSNIQADIHAYISSTSNSNLLLVPTTSAFTTSVLGQRYQCNREAKDATIGGEGPTWNTNFHPCYQGRLYYSGNQDYGSWLPKLYWLFEYTDKVARIGYGHIVRTEFTAEEVLLERAEARIFMNNLPGAVADLKIWDDARKKLPIKTDGLFVDLTDALINRWYAPANASSRHGLLAPLNIDQVNSESQYKLNDNMLPYLWCVLHFRRHETIFEGLRWFDIKRFGIEITHNIGRDRVETLKLGDPRRALQIPSAVINAGIEQNDRFPSSNAKAAPYELSNEKLVIVRK